MGIFRSEWIRMNIAICDDSEADALAAKEVIRNTLTELHVQADIEHFLSAEEIESKLLKRNEHLDVLILDIDMPEVSGLQLAEKLRAGNLNLIIIFLSNHEEFVFKAIEFQPFRYIRKIKLKTEMPLAIRAAVRIIEIQKDKQIILETDDGEMKVMMSEIMYFETDKKKRKLSVHLTNNKTLLVNKTLSELQNILDHERYIMIHRSCVVNADYIKNIDNNVLVLDNDEQLLISRPRNKEVKQKLLKLWGDTI